MMLFFTSSIHKFWIIACSTYSKILEIVFIFSYNGFVAVSNSSQIFLTSSSLEASTFQAFNSY
ncbi:MAG: hypothetical protein LBD88_00340 [Candidatus Peribacteria bacterium]|nr:hypothetical protein [Candidatus Peribacteria bacterium]